MVNDDSKLDPRDETRMARSVARLEHRRRTWKQEARRSLATAFAVMGLGWLVVVPAVLGFAVGHWLDGRYDTGVMLGAGFGFAGLSLGCWSAWRRVVREHEREHR